MCSLYGCPAYREKVKSAAGLIFYDLAEKSNNDVLVPCLCLGKKKEKKKQSRKWKHAHVKLDAKNGHVLFRRPSFSSFIVNGRDRLDSFHSLWCVCVCVCRSRHFDCPRHTQLTPPHELILAPFLRVCWTGLAVVWHFTTTSRFCVCVIPSLITRPHLSGFFFV